MAVGSGSGRGLRASPCGRPARTSEAHATVEFVTTDAPAATTLRRCRRRRRPRLELRSRRSPGAPTASTTGGRASHPTSASVRRSAASGRSAAGRCSSSRPPWPTGASTYPTFDGRFYALGRPHRQDDLEPPDRALRLGFARSQRTARLRHVHRATGDLRRLGARADDGIVVAYDAGSGKVVVAADDGAERILAARRRAGSSTSATGTASIWALDARTGRTRWTFRARRTESRARSRSPAAECSSATTTVTSTRSTREPAGSPGAPPRSLVWAVAAPSTQRRRSATGASSSATRTARSTHSARPAGGCSGRRAPAATSTPRLPIWRRLILVGSYDHSFYALDAATGDVRWRFRANGPISGSASVIAGVVYFATFAERTYALDARPRAASSGAGRTGSTRRSSPTGSGSIWSVSAGSTGWSRSAEPHGRGQPAPEVLEHRGRRRATAPSRRSSSRPAAKTFAPRASRSRSSRRSCRGRRCRGSRASTLRPARRARASARRSRSRSTPKRVAVRAARCPSKSHGARARR